jgi:microcompartment protein CcmL/EutN
MAYTMGEALTTSRKIRQAIADAEQVAATLPLVALGKAPGGQAAIMLTGAIAELTAQRDAILTDAAD